jgi:urease accessory protein
MIEAPQSLPEWVPALLQVSDPLFPTGAYAHSLGLEQWAATCGYQTAEDLIEFFKEHAGPSLARLDLPYLRLALQAVHAQDIQRLLELDAELDALKWASEIRAASTAQGRGRLRLLKQLWGGSTLIEAYAAAVQEQNAYGHHLIVSALQFERLGVPEAAALMTYGYQSLANFVAASVKLLRISPESAQRALHAGLVQLPDWVQQSGEVATDTIGWFAPAFDIACARHATAFSRLFIS